MCQVSVINTVLISQHLNVSDLTDYLEDKLEIAKIGEDKLEIAKYRRR
jgi:hypothetical protein